MPRKLIINASNCPTNLKQVLNSLWSEALGQLCEGM